MSIGGAQLSVTDAELIFAKVIGLLNDKRFDIDKELGASPLRNAKVMKLYAETESKRAKLDFKAFYYAITIIAKRAYPDLSTNRALISLTEKVQISGIIRRTLKHWKRGTHGWRRTRNC